MESSREQQSRSRQHLIAAGLASAAIALIAIGCGGGEDGDSGSSEDTVVFGGDLSLSGPLQVFGKPAEQGLNGAVAAINDDGGIEAGDTTYDAEAFFADNRSDPSESATAARAVVDAGAIAALGPDLAADVVYNIFKQNEIIMWTVSFPQQIELQSDPDANPLLFSAVPFFVDLYGQQMKQIAAEFPDIERIAIIAPNDEEGQGAAESWAGAAEASDIEVVGQHLFEHGTTDFSGVLTSVKADSPDLVVALQSPEDATAIMQQAQQLEVAKYALNDAITADQVIEADLDETTVLIPNFAPTLSQAATIPDYQPEEVFGDSPPQGAPGAGIVNYYWAQIVAQTIEEVGTATDAAAIAEALPGQSYDGPFGECAISEAHALNCETPLDVVEGNEVTVYRFPNPESTTPIAVYTCRDGTCEEQEG